MSKYRITLYIELKCVKSQNQLQFHMYYKMNILSSENVYRCSSDCPPINSYSMGLLGFSGLAFCCVPFCILCPFLHLAFCCAPFCIALPSEQIMPFNASQTGSWQRIAVHYLWDWDSVSKLNRFIPFHSIGLNGHFLFKAPSWFLARASSNHDSAHQSS